MINEQDVRNIAKEEIESHAHESQFNVGPVRAHTHNGVDSTPINTINLSNYFIRLFENQNQLTAANYAVSHTLFVNDNMSGIYKVGAVSAVFSTASTSGTLQIEVATGTQAIASGSNQLSAAMSLAGTANTTVNGLLLPNLMSLTAGARINLIFGGTVTNLAKCAVTVVLRLIG